MAVTGKRLCILVLKDCVPEAGIPWSLEYRQAVSVLELVRDEEPSIYLGRMALAFQSPEIHAALFPRPDSQEHWKEQSVEQARRCLPTPFHRPCLPCGLTALPVWPCCW